MTKQVRSAGWIAPARPEWVSRVNAEGKNIDLAGVIPLDERSLIDSAVRNTGLADFGDEAWREPFRIFITALEEEAQLNLMGRLMTRADLLTMLEARLQIEETYKRHPEIEEEEIVRPLLIIGHARTGTSALQYLLATDPANGTTKTWEVVFPYPPPRAETYLTDPRIERADRLTTLWNRVAPELESMHTFNGKIPTESIQLDCLSFVSPAWFSLLGRVPSYDAYANTRSWDSCYRYEKRALKLLQWKNPRRRWVLKTPAFLIRIPEVLRAYPDACFIWTHRDPVVSLASALNLLGTLQWIRSDHPLGAENRDQLTAINCKRAESLARMQEQAIDWIETGVLPRQQLCNVLYRDFVKQPLGVAGEIYAKFDIPFTDAARAAMQRHIEMTWRPDRPRHQYDTGSDEDIRRDRLVFQKYQQYFGVPNEI